MASNNQKTLSRLVSSSSVMMRSMGKATQITLGQIMERRCDLDRHSRRTRIVCTMGPACWDVETLVKMIDAGMNVARLNFSHGDHATHQRTLGNIEKALAQRPDAHIAILLDTKGPEIRTGKLTDGAPIEIPSGHRFKLTTDYAFVGDVNCVACSYAKLPQSVEVGSVILIADGSLSAQVVEILEDGVMLQAQNAAVIGEHKNMNLPSVKVDLPCIGERDKRDILEFGLPNHVSFIAMSFVQSAQDIRGLRALLGPAGKGIRIIPKIENLEGLVNFDEILAEADGVMIARGDLGMEIPPEKVFLAQKMAIAKCNVAGKPVITATQMLESMTSKPRPTRAEVADVANAVLDGTDCVMLSGETAGGAFPIAAVEVMAATCLEAETCIDYCQLYNAMVAALPGHLDTPEAVARAAVSAARAVEAAIIIVLTETGYTAKLVAKYRPHQVIFALSTSDTTTKHLCIHRGVIVLQTPSFQGTEALVRAAILVAKERLLCGTGDSVIVVHGTQEDVAGGANIVKIVTVD